MDGLVLNQRTNEEINISINAFNTWKTQHIIIYICRKIIFVRKLVLYRLPTLTILIILCHYTAFEFLHNDIIPFVEAELSTLLTIHSIHGILSFLVILFLFLTAFIEPGIIQSRRISNCILNNNKENNQQSLINNDENDNKKDDHRRDKNNEEKYECQKCYHICNERTIHCTECEHCVEELDHYCNIIGVDIGKRNYPFFLTFITMLFILCMVSLIICICDLFLIPYTSLNGWHIIMFLLIFPFIYLGYINYIHWCQLMFTGQTSIEYGKWSKYKKDPKNYEFGNGYEYMADSRKYDKGGWWKNVIYKCCNKPMSTLISNTNDIESKYGSL